VQNKTFVVEIDIPSLR